MTLENALRKIAKFEEKNYNFILIIFLILTLIVGSGIFYLKVQSDMNKSFPQDLDYFVTTNRVTEKFGGQDTVVLLISLDEDYDSNDAPLDIRDPEVIKFISKLSEKLADENDIDSVTSLNSIFSKTGVPSTTSGVIQILSNIPASKAFFNDAYTKTVIFLTADLGSNPEKLNEVEKIVKEKSATSGIPAGIKVEVTGTPSMINLVFNLLISDAVKTLLIGALIIFVLLIFTQKSFTKAGIIFLPLIFSIFWTLGTMGWLDLPISLATAGIGAMVLGLGVEYGVFLFSRYQEEKLNGVPRLESMEIALSNIGSSILGSGMTTIVGFLALMASTMPMLRDLGLSLALGIFYCLIVTIFITPSFILFEESLIEWVRRKK